jgi:hypothetical protein
MSVFYQKHDLSVARFSDYLMKWYNCIKRKEGICMGDTAHAISQAIKEASWLSIKYKNAEGDITYYWCAVNDIKVADKKLVATLFNAAKLSESSNGIIEEAVLSFDSILKAEVMPHTTYSRPEHLITTIRENISELGWLKFDRFNNDIVNYIKDCMIHDTIAYQRETTLVPGIDENALKTFDEEHPFELSPMQIATMTENIQKLKKQDRKRSFQTTELAINVLSIHTHQGLFVAAYRRLMFDPSERGLVMGKDIVYNYEFTAEDNGIVYRHNLRNYLDIETDAFTELFEKSPEEAKELLKTRLDSNKETIDDRPYIMDIIRRQDGHLADEMGSIAQHKSEGTLSKPLEAFFGNMDTSMASRKRKFDIVILDEKMNIDQLRVIHNALKEPVTYVQGPPGTGKTHSIINLLISAFFNGQTVLISSNNNKPIDDIYKKITDVKSRGNAIPFPILRLGNNEKTLEAIETIKELMKRCSRFTADRDKLEKHALTNQDKMKDLNMVIDQYESKLSLEEETSALESLAHTLSDNMRITVIQAILQEKRKAYEAIRSVDDTTIHDHVVKADNTFMTWLFFTSVKHIKRLDEPKYEEFRAILDVSDDLERVRLFNRYLSEDANLDMLKRVFPVMMTTNQSAYKFGNPKPQFDLVVIDEAGQCSIGHALYPMNRAKRLLLVGDKNQLKPVITLAPQTNQALMRKYRVPIDYDYVTNSVISLMQKVDSISKFVMLRYHYRSRKDIIDFSNKKYYRNQLILKEDDVMSADALRYIDVDQGKSQRSNERNTSMDEIEAIVTDIKKRTTGTLGVVTPFRNQARMIKERFAEEGLGHIDVGTVHTFQGDEKDVIYLTTAITPHSSDKTFDWVKNNEELINVATTRAKKTFVMVSDMKELKKRSNDPNDLHELAQYVKHKGREVPLTPRREGHYRQYNQAKEKEFMETLAQVLSFYPKYKVQSQVKILDILNRYANPALKDYGTKAVFDFVVFGSYGKDDRPRLVVELDGPEHHYDKLTMERDQKKEQICKDNGIKLIRITNDYARRYVHVKHMINTIIKD